jgi:YgiT-type zinc finger domain-containing protein
MHEGRNVNSQASKISPMACIECGRKTEPTILHVTMWTDKGLVVVENVPAHACHECEEQFYDDRIGAKILELANKGFPRDKMVREITVPVYSIEEETVGTANELPEERQGV